MFPEETHVKIVKRVDELEADLFRVYRRLERLRLDLQAMWRVLPSGGKWSERSQAASEFSVSSYAQPQSAGAVDPAVASSHEPSTRVKENE